MNDKIFFPRNWSKKLDSKNRMVIDKNINTFYDILEHDLFFFPEYTNHKIMHINHIMKISEKLVPKVCDKYLTATDVMCYVIAVLYHDIGMHITYEGFLRIIKEGCLDDIHGEVYHDLPWEQLWDQYILDAKLWSEEKRKHILGNSEGIHKLHVLKIAKDISYNSAELNFYDRIFIGEFLRRYHCRLAYDISCMGFPDAQKNILELPAEWKKIIGHIARSHGENIWDMSDLVKKQYGSNFRKYRDTHILYLMVLLRIADYFDISEERASINIYHLFHFLSPVSAQEWKKNQIVQGVCFNVVNDPEVLFIETFPPDNSSLFLEIKNLFEEMQRELDMSWSVLGDTYGNFPDKLQLSIRRVKSDLLNFSTEGHSVDYLPEPIAFRTNSAILKLMVGPLYDYSPKYGIRELLQNAIDACKEKQILCQSRGESYHGQVMVEAVFLENGKSCICVSDNGIGMTKDVIKNYYLIAGSSFRSDPLWKENFMEPDAHRVLAGRNGRFGIGVLATYLLGDDVHVETTSYMENTTYYFDAILDANQMDVYKKFVADKDSGTMVSINVLSTVMEKIKYDFKQKWYCRVEPEIIFKLSGKLIKGFHPEKVDWSSCVLSTGNQAFYSFLENDYIENGIYVNGLLVEEGKYSIAVDIIEENEEVSLSLNRNTLIGIAGHNINGLDIQMEVLCNELFAFILICNPFQIRERLKFRKWGGSIEEQILFTSKGFCLLGWLDDFVKSTVIYLGYSSDVLCSEERLSDFCKKLGQDADDLYFTQGNFKEVSKDYPQILPELDNKNIRLQLKSVIVNRDYFSMGDNINKNIVSNTIGLLNYVSLSSKEIAEDGKLFLCKEFDNQDLIYRLKKIWKNKAGHPIALYKGAERKSKANNLSHVHQFCLRNMKRYFCETDRLIPYTMEDRKKKFPRAFRELELYIKNAEVYSNSFPGSQKYQRLLSKGY